MSKMHRAQILLDPEQHDALPEIARQDGTSISEIVRTAVESWPAEVVSILRQAIYAHILPREEGRVAVENIFRLSVKVIHSDQSLCQQTLAWVERLGQSKAYDSFYLALAERLGAGLWTSDRRLFNRMQQLGINWVKSM